MELVNSEVMKQVNSISSIAFNKFFNYVESPSPEYIKVSTTYLYYKSVEESLKKDIELTTRRWSDCVNKIQTSMLEVHQLDIKLYNYNTYEGVSAIENRIKILKKKIEGNKYQLIKYKKELDTWNTLLHHNTTMMLNLN